MADLIPVVIVDDQLIQREGITRVVEATGKMRVVGAVSTGAEAAAIVRSEPIQLALIDLVLQQEHGTRVGRDLRNLCALLQVIIYTREKSMVLAAEIFREQKDLAQPSLQGYLLTRNVSSSSYLLQVYQHILDSGYFIDPDVLRWHYQLAKLEKLTPREEECAHLVVRGLSNAQIAEAMVVSRRRVENLINSLYQKFQILGESGDPARRVILVESIRLLDTLHPVSRALSVLIIDDQPYERLRLCQAFKGDARFQGVTEAADGEQGIEAAARRRPDIALIDIHLPDMDGFEAARRILARLPRTKVILTSNEKSSLYQEMSLEAGAVAFLPKESVSAEAVCRSCDLWEQ